MVIASIAESSSHSITVAVSEKKELGKLIISFQLQATALINLTIGLLPA
jgi:hypothetical protein